MTSPESYAAPATAAAIDTKADGPVGIGGWLLLVIAGLVLTAGRVVYLLATNHFTILRDGLWFELTNPAGRAYHPLWAPMLVFEIVGNLGLVALAIATLVAMARKSRLAPKLGIAVYAWSLVFVIADFFLANMIPAVAAQPDTETSKEITRSVVAAAIWIPYLLKSTRVRNTFVR